MTARRPRVRAGALALALLAAGCGRATDDPAPNGVSAREADALNDAATMVGNDGDDAIVVTNADDGAGNLE